MKGCFWKSAPQWQIYRRELLPKFYYPFKPLSILNFTITKWSCYVTCFAKVFLVLLFSLKHDTFIIKKFNTHQVRCYHLFIVFRHTGKVGPRPWGGTLKWDPGDRPCDGILEWDPGMGPWGKTRGWDSGMGPWGRTLGWDPGVGHWDGTFGWEASVKQWSETLEWYSHACFF